MTRLYSRHTTTHVGRPFKGRRSARLKASPSARCTDILRLWWTPRVRLWVDRPGSAKRRTTLGDDRDLPIVYEDDVLIVLNKPAGLLAVPLPPERRHDAPSLFEDLKSYLRGRGRRRPFVVHRIDRDTSGLVLFAKTAAAQATLKAQFKRHQPERVYQAVVYGHPSPLAGTWRD